MSFRPPLLVCLCLLSVPLAAEPLRSGAMRLRLSAAPGSPLLQPGEDPVARLCAGAQTPEVIFGENSPTCRAKVLNGQPILPTAQTTQPFLQIGLLSIQRADDGTFRAALFARALGWNDPRPIETPCGRFTWSLRLDPRATQPVSEAILQPGAHDTGRGTVSGELRMAAQIRFESSGHRVVVVPVTLSLPLNGSWARSEEGANPTTPDASNLLFFADRPACARLRPLTGRACLSPVPEGAKQ
jgi:hypothetical protein